MKYKAIISDIDGTLTQKMSRTQQQPLPSEKVRDAVLATKGIVHFSIATSRPLPRVTYLLDNLEVSDPCIIINGALIVNGKTHQILNENLLPEEEVLFLAKYFQKKNLNFVIDERNTMEVPFTSAYKPNNPLNVFVSELTDEQAKEIEHDLAERKGISLHKVPSWSNHLWGFNISNVTASKQHGVLEIAKILGIQTEEIIGIGDGYNDFPLLMACGLKVAMGNAVPELKAIADYIAPTIDEDGVVDVIEKFVLKPQ